MNFQWHCSPGRDMQISRGYAAAFANSQKLPRNGSDSEIMRGSKTRHNWPKVVAETAEPKCSRDRTTDSFSWPKGNSGMELLENDSRVFGRFRLPEGESSPCDPSAQLIGAPVGKGAVHHAKVISALTGDT